MFQTIRAVLIVAAMMVLLPPNSFTQEMTTVERYIQQNDFGKNPGAAEHVFLRCSAALLIVGYFIQENASDMGAQGSDLMLEKRDTLLSLPAYPEWQSRCPRSEQTTRCSGRWP